MARSTATAPSQRPANAPAEAEAPPAQQPPEGGASVAAAVAAAAVLAALAGDGKTLPVPPAARAVHEATGELLDAMDRVFRDRRAQFHAHIIQAAEREMPGISPTRVGELAGEEMLRETEFQRKAHARLEKDLPAALGLADPAKRAEAVGKILEREKRYIAQREGAAAQRLVAALEADQLQEASPQGAYWKLSPYVRNHCVRCLAMSGKFWPWQVLSAYRIPVHPNCACRLLSLNEAITQGLMTAADIPDAHGAADYAKQLMDEASRLEESMSHEEIGVMLAQLDLSVAEASFRELLRWGSGTTHGGEFRPKSGGDPGDQTKKLVEKLRAELVGARPLRGRTVPLLGVSTFIPHDTHWEQKHGKHVYSSPAGSTHIYRDGKLLDAGGPAKVSPTTSGELTGAPKYGGWKTVGEPSKPVEPPYSFTPDPITTEPSSATGTGVIPDYSSTPLSMGKHAGGTTGAQWAFDAKGDRWLVKSYKGNSDRVASELLANAIYRDLGANVTMAGTYRGKDNHGRSVTALAYPTLPGDTRKIEAPSAELGKHFMADALVANWDFIGLTDDNVLWTPASLPLRGPKDNPAGVPVRLDQGGTFQFRAQGAPKPYGPVPTEVWTMLHPGGQGFDKVDVTERGMRQQAQKIGEVLTPERVHELVHSAPWHSTRMRGEVEQTLNERVQWMREFGEGEHSLPRPLTGSQIGTHMREQVKLEPPPEHMAALQAVLGTPSLKERMQARMREKAKLSITQNALRLRLDEVIRRSRAPQDLTVYRPINAEQLGNLDNVVGKVVHDKGYGTATSSRSAARDAPGMLEIHVPAGSPILHTPSLEGVDTSDPHNELLLPRGARLRVKRVSKRAGQTVVHAVVIG